MYFRNFPTIYYTYDINGEQVLKAVKDISVNVRFRSKVLENITLFDEYDIKDGETAEIISAQYYGNSNYHWIVMLTNEKYDYIEDWPMQSSTLNAVIDDEFNRFDITSWTYTAASGYTYITATCPNHGITSSQITSSMTNPVKLANVYIGTSNTSTGQTVTEVATGLAASGTITSVTTNQIVIRMVGTFTNTVPDTWPTGSYSWAPKGGFKLATSNRQYLIKHYEVNNHVVDSSAIGAVAVTHYDYRVRENDSKRRIKLISPNLVGLIINELENVIKVQ